MTSPAVPQLPPESEERFRAMWGIQHLLAGRAVEAQRSDEQLLESLRVQSVLTTYTYFYDGGDLDRLMVVFHPECRLVNPRGTYVGTDAIRRNYEYLMTQPFVRFHNTSNVMAQVDDDGEGAWLTAYLFCISGGATTWTSLSGTYTARLTRFEGEWRFRHLRISGNVKVDDGALLPNTPGPPVPDEAVTSGDWVGPGWVR